MEQVKTTYIVKDVREQYGRVDNPIILICDTCEPIPARRRIRIPDYKDEVYANAQMLAAGDVFELTENILNNVHEDGQVVRTINNIEPKFRKQVW